ATRDAPAVEADLLLDRPAGRLNGTTLDLVGKPVRVDDHADVGGDRELADTDLCDRLDVGDDGQPAGHVLVAGVPDAAAPAVGNNRGAPPGRLGYPLEHVPAALIVQMAEPELQRVDAGGHCQLVHERLDGEHVGKPAQ